MNSSGIKSWFGFTLLVVLFFTQPVHANDLDSVHQESIRRGNSEMRIGSRVMWTGAALLPISALALVPVLYDGAFGITAADPGFAVFFAVVGGGLIHAGIPIYGFGAGNLENAVGGETSGGAPGSAGIVETGWSHYRRSWKFMTSGSAVLVVAIPFAIMAALDLEGENAGVRYTASTLGITGLGLVAVGFLEQYYSLYRFVNSAGSSRELIQARHQVSLQPVLMMNMNRQALGAGMRLTSTF